MEDRITVNFMYVSLVSILLTLLLSLFGFQSMIEHQAQNDLAQTARLIAQAYQTDQNGSTLSALASDGLSIAHLSHSGALLYSDNALMISDADLRSLLDAGSQGAATALYKSTDGTALVCAAVPASDGTVLCVFTHAPKLFSTLSRHYGYLIFLLLLLAAFSLFLSILLTRRLVKPIKSLPQQMTQMDFDYRKINIYPELIPLIREVTERRNERETMRQEFTANVSHELKTPLTTISGYSEMIAGGIVRPEDIQRFAAKIHSESERMQSLVADIIELNALDSEVTLEHPEPVHLLPLAQDCIEQLSPSFLEKGLSVYITGAGFSVLGDSRQLWELIYNLLDNARRYNVQNGSIHISIQDQVLTVKDTGIGIPPEHQGRVFERFYRVDKSHSRATGGTGLGLSIVKHVAELHHAKIELKSTEQVGTEIRIIFPS